jgi:hypothetical protein
MTKGRKKNPSSRWTKFEPVKPFIDGEPLEVQEGESFWRNSFYTVVKKKLDDKENDEGALHLSIRHNQGKAVRDWRHFQKIKNELAGEEREALEIFPKESDLIDVSNSYHLFVLPAGDTSMFTWREGRHVTSDPSDEETKAWVESQGGDPNSIVGVAQRPLEGEEGLVE